MSSSITDILERAGVTQQQQEQKIGEEREKKNERLARLGVTDTQGRREREINRDRHFCFLLYPIAITAAILFIVLFRLFRNVR